MSVLAIDPGSKQSAWLLLQKLGGGEPLWSPVIYGITENNELANMLHGNLCGGRHLAIETLFVRGMPTAQEEMETQFWAGRFVEAASMPYTQIRRLDVKLTICGSVRATDSNIRAALIDRYGGKDRAIGNKKLPGPLREIKADLWSALGIAWTWVESQKHE